MIFMQLCLAVFLFAVLFQYTLVCGRFWMGSFTVTLYMAGYLIGSVASGIISDR